MFAATQLILSINVNNIFCFICAFSQKKYYRNDPKFSDRYAWAKSADPDQTAPKEQSDQGLHCLQFRLHRLDSFLYGRVT